MSFEMHQKDRLYAQYADITHFSLSHTKGKDYILKFTHKLRIKFKEIGYHDRSEQDNINYGASSETDLIHNYFF